MSALCSSLVDLTDKEKSGILIEAYKKHSSELLALENSQIQFTTLVLAVFSAGASFLASAVHQNNVALKVPAKLGLTLVVIAFMAISYVLSSARSRARIAIRKLMVDVEQALRFYEPGVFLEESSLYPTILIAAFPKSGDWLGRVNWLSWLAGGGVLILLWAA